MDLVKIQVALLAADPPDNIAYRITVGRFENSLIPQRISCLVSGSDAPPNFQHARAIQ